MEKEKMIILRVEGITCPGCAMDIENILGAMDGIHTVSVNFTEDTVKICYDGNEIEEQDLIARVRRLGLHPTKTGP
jgi:copper chaperone CopZ